MMNDYWYMKSDANGGPKWKPITLTICKNIIK